MRKYIWLLALLLVGGTGPRPAAADSAAWQDTGFAFAAIYQSGGYCIDPLQPHVLLWVSPQQGTMAFDWLSFGNTRINTHAFSLCAPSGYLYGADPAAAPNARYWRFSSADPEGRALARLPTHVAHDGSLLVYRLDPPQVTAGGALQQPGHLWASADAGLTWQERGQQFRGHVESLALAEADAHVLYALTVDRPTAITRPVPYTVWRSTDAGVTWAHGAFAQLDPGQVSHPYLISTQIKPPQLLLEVVPNPAAPVSQVLLTFRFTYTNERNSPGPTQVVDHVELSRDGGQTFADLGCRACDTYLGSGISYVHTPAGLLILISSYFYSPHVGGEQYVVSRWTDAGQRWTPISPALAAGGDLVAVPAAPANVLLDRWGSNSGLDYSADNGDTWQTLATDGDLVGVTPYLPLTVLRLAGGTLQTLALPAAGARQVAPVATPRQAPGGADFATTGHYVPAVLLNAWQKNGGLAQFGYPRTDAFREVSDTDGRVYLTQYFERARLEYHPEFAGTGNEVLLGLLGNQVTATRRAGDEAAFRPVADPHTAGVLFLPPTRHTLRGPFLQYWQTRGGVAIYGWPISEELPEVSPTDGQTYTVQYFERNRFEYHPEHAGTPYAVLLGLLGNTILEQKGWR